MGPGSAKPLLVRAEQDNFPPAQWERDYIRDHYRDVIRNTKKIHSQLSVVRTHPLEPKSIKQRSHKPIPPDHACQENLDISRQVEPPDINHEPFHERQTPQNRHHQYQFLQILDFQEQQTAFAEQTPTGEAHQQQCGAIFPNPTFLAVIQLCGV